MSNVKFTIYDGDVHVNTEITEDKKDKIIERLLEFCKENDCVESEVLGQSDRAILDAPNTLCDIMNILDFKTIYL